MFYLVQCSFSDVSEVSVMSLLKTVSSNYSSPSFYHSYIFLAWQILTTLFFSINKIQKEHNSCQRFLVDCYVILHSLLCFFFTVIEFLSSKLKLGIEMYSRNNLLASQFPEVWCQFYILGIPCTYSTVYLNSGPPTIMGSPSARLHILGMYSTV